uniref:7TM_GPCR_Srx domain-containing protein n=1 Tax=Elaeophora elaphi TaxID=1147741 RepID=A0A0R3RNR1_9BILA
MLVKSNPNMNGILIILLSGISVSSIFQTIHAIAICQILVVVSAILENIFDTEQYLMLQVLMMCCVYLRLLNSFNLVMLFLCRQKDFQHVAIQRIFCERKNVNAVASVGFTRTNHTVI